jgi:N-acyl-L-homoserine lactone synthetase
VPSPKVEVATTPPPLPEGYESLVVVGGELALQAVELEYQVFTDADFFPKTASGRIEDYDPYTSRSLFHVVTNADQRVVGMVRSLIGPYGSLPIGRYADSPWANCPVDPVCEYASLAVAPGERGDGVAEELYRSVFALAWNSRASGLVALVDRWFHELLNSYYGCSFELIGPEVEFSYGTVIPIGVSWTSLELHMSRHAPEFWQWLKMAIEDFDVTLDMRDLVLEGRPLNTPVIQGPEAARP